MRTFVDLCVSFFSYVIFISIKSHGVSRYYLQFTVEKTGGMEWLSEFKLH